MRSYLGDSRAKVPDGERYYLEADVAYQPVWSVDVAPFDNVTDADSVHLSEPWGLTISPSAGYGRYIGSALGGNTQARLDITVKYDWNAKRGARHNRAVGEIYLTQGISGQGSAIMGLVWANHPEFLGEVDRKIRANIGLVYKLNK